MSILKGYNVTDIALGESGFNYFLYTRPGGSGIIMRGTVAETEYRFYFFRGATTELVRATNIQAQWDARADKGYMRPSNLSRF